MSRYDQGYMEMKNRELAQKQLWAICFVNVLLTLLLVLL